MRTISYLVCAQCILAASSVVWDPAMAANPAPAVLPNLQLTRGGVVRAIVVQPDGRLIVGGNFTSINGVPRQFLARLNPDGTVDPSWDPSPSDPVTQLAANDHAIFVLGSFTNIGGLDRIGLAKLNLSDGTLDAVWDPHPNRPPATLAVNGAEVFISGGFSSVGGQSRMALAKLSADGVGTVDAEWNPGMAGSASAMAVDGPYLYVGGYYYQIGGVDRTSLARLTTSGAGVVDPVWAPRMSAGTTVGAILPDGTNVYVESMSGLQRFSTLGTGPVDTAWGPLPSSMVYVLLKDGAHLYVGGSFSSVGSLPRRGLARISLEAGTVDPSWDANLDQDVWALALSGAGLYVGGAFEHAGNALGLGLARVDPDSAQRDPTFAPRVQLPGHVFALAVQPEGHLIVGGRFAFAGDVPRQNLARTHPDGSLDLAWAPHANSTVTRLLVHGEDLFVAGHFTIMGGLSRYRLAKVSLAGAGATDPTWNPNMDTDINSHVLDLAALGTNLFVGGFWNQIGGRARMGLAKLSTTGTGSADPNWDPAPGPCCSGYLVESLVLIGNDLFVCGVFTRIGGLNREHLAKLQTEGTGAADAVWNPNPVGGYAQWLRTDGAALFVSGGFTNIGGQDRWHLAKLSATGTGEVDPAWNCGAENRGYPLVVHRTNLYVASFFTNAIGEMLPLLGRLSTTGTGAVDSDWHPAPNVPPPHIRGDAGYPTTCTYASAANDSAVYVGGKFTLIGGAVRNGLAAFDEFPLRPRFRRATYTPNGFSCEIALEPNQPHRLQVSSDLSEWHDAATFTSTVPVMPFEDHGATNSKQRFFRIVSP